jgi:hypothetical protein
VAGRTERWVEPLLVGAAHIEISAIGVQVITALLVAVFATALSASAQRFHVENNFRFDPWKR